MDKTNNQSDAGVTEADIDVADRANEIWVESPRIVSAATIAAALARQQAIAQHEGDEKPVAWMSSLSELRERLRCEMLATKLTSGRDTYEDGFAQGLSHSIGSIDHILARLASTPATPAQMWEG